MIKKAAALAVCLSLVFSLSACSSHDKTGDSGKNAPTEGGLENLFIGQSQWNQFSMIADLSDVTWYLTQNYGNDVPENCKY